MRAGTNGVQVHALGHAVLDLFHLAFQALARQLFQFVGQGQVRQGCQQQHQACAHYTDRQPQAHRQTAGFHPRASST